MKCHSGYANPGLADVLAETSTAWGVASRATGVVRACRNRSDAADLSMLTLDNDPDWVWWLVFYDPDHGWVEWATHYRLSDGLRARWGHSCRCVEVTWGVPFHQRQMRAD